MRPRFSFTLFPLALLCGVLCCLVPTSRADETLVLPLGLRGFQDMGGADLTAVQQEAVRQATGPNTGEPRFRSMTAPHHAIFEGDFKPRNNDVLLAIFADDGANVSRAEIGADGTPGNWTPLAQKLGVGQTLPKLEQSFALIDVPWDSTKTYRIRVDYKNLIYKLNTTDIDGLTLFAFNGGGTVTDFVVVTDLTTAPFVQLNDDWDEQNRNAAGAKVADFTADAAAGERIVAADSDIASASLDLSGAKVSGKWKLTFNNRIKIWRDTNGTFTPVASNAEFDVTVPKSVALKIEGISASTAIDDVTITATFTPTGKTAMPAVEKKLTVAKVNLAVAVNDVGELDEETPGAWVHFNLDDDNLSDTPNVVTARPGADFEEVVDAVTGENDLKWTSISLGSVFGATEGRVTIQTTTGIKLWKSPTKGADNFLLGSGTQKTWDLSNNADRTQLGTMSNLYVEGTSANVSSSLQVTYQRQVNGNWYNVGMDKVNYDVIASDAGVQPKTANVYISRFNYQGTVKGPYPDPNQRQRWHDGRKNTLINVGAWPNIIDCQFSITDNRFTEQYNCIAESVDETFSWYNEKIGDQGTNVIGIDETYGDGDGVFEISDMDAFYLDKKGWAPIVTVDSIADKAKDAQAMHYSGYHSARRKPNSLSGIGRWIMYESKIGSLERIEHVWDQLNGSDYGNPIRFYH